MAISNLFSLHFKYVNKERTGKIHKQRTTPAVLVFSILALSIFTDKLNLLFIKMGH